MLLLLALVCAAPVIASYLMYYVFKPTGGTTSYGALIEPQRPIPGELMVTDEKGQPMPLTALRGKWLMVIVNGSDCNEQCATRLYFMRQVRALQSAERERVVERLAAHRRQTCRPTSSRTRIRSLIRGCSSRIRKRSRDGCRYPTARNSPTTSFSSIRTAI